MSTAAIQQMIVDAAARYGVPPNVALGVAAHESGFNPNATNLNSNGTRDWGVMQLNDTTVQTLGVSNPLDPQQNIDAGVGLLSSLLAKYGGDVNSALWAYASGSGNVGPNKTPNSTAQGFINYVTSYDGGTISGAPSDSTSGFDLSALLADTGITSDANPSESSLLNPGFLVGALFVGLAVYLAFRD